MVLLAVLIVMFKEIGTFVAAVTTILSMTFMYVWSTRSASV